MHAYFGVGRGDGGWGGLPELGQLGAELGVLGLQLGGVGA
jgi:hypothetical protein